MYIALKKRWSLKLKKNLSTWLLYKVAVLAGWSMPARGELTSERSVLSESHCCASVVRSFFIITNLESWSQFGQNLQANEGGIPLFACRFCPKWVRCGLSSYKVLTFFWQTMDWQKKPNLFFLQKHEYSMHQSSTFSINHMFWKGMGWRTAISLVKQLNNFFPWHFKNTLHLWYSWGKFFTPSHLHSYCTQVSFLETQPTLNYIPSQHFNMPKILPG